MSEEHSRKIIARLMDHMETLLLLTLAQKAVLTNDNRPGWEDDVIASQQLLGPHVRELTSTLREILLPDASGTLSQVVVDRVVEDLLRSAFDPELPEE